jgi:hypothetical protein
MVPPELATSVHPGVRRETDRQGRWLKPNHLGPLSIETEHTARFPSRNYRSLP